VKTCRQFGRLQTVVALAVLFVAILWITTFWLLLEPIGTSSSVSHGQVPAPETPPRASLPAPEKRPDKPVDKPVVVNRSSPATPEPAPGGAFAVDPFAAGGPTPVYVAPQQVVPNGGSDDRNKAKF
jgi:hypothetical protein